jgi:hypothetical protein
VTGHVKRGAKIIAAARNLRGKGAWAGCQRVADGPFDALRRTRLAVSMAGIRTGEMPAKAPCRPAGSRYGRVLSGFGPGRRRCQGGCRRECADHGADRG